jgi:hypothetical protein
MRLNELIERLEDIRDEHGGDIFVEWEDSGVIVREDDVMVHVFPSPVSARGITVVQFGETH